MVFLLNFLAGVFAFTWTMIDQKGLFSVAGDFNVQQIPFAMAANDAIKSGRVIWDWSLDLGSNFTGGMAFYILGNPSFWLSLLFPSSWFMYLVGWFYILKYATAGLTSYIWMKKYVRNSENAAIASMMYAFSGFMAENLLFYHFHDVVALFPLMLITFDDLVQNNRKGRFVFAVLLNAIVNYFFFVGEVIFLVAYFIFRYVCEDGRQEWKKLGRILPEAVLGVASGAVLLLPAAIFTLQNPRVKFDYWGNNALVYGMERYLYILKAMIFPGEVMSDQSAVINRNFASCAAYLPMVSMVLVITFWHLHRNEKHWMKRILIFSLLCAVVPILNAAFSLFAGLYHRWYYMPVLFFSLCGALVLDEWEKETNLFDSPTPAEQAISRSTLIWLLITAGFVVFLLFVPWSSSEKSKIYRPDVFAAWTCVSVAGSVLTWLFLTQLPKKRKMFFALGVFLFAVGTNAAALALYHVANGEDALHLHDRLECAKKFEYSEPWYRFNNNDNPETLGVAIPGTGNFCSTVSGSIFRFYEGLGLSRDVKSPEAPTGMSNLVSAKFTYTKTPREDETPVQVVEGTYYTYYIYKDESVPPIGFTYDTYITYSELTKSLTQDRAILMLKTLVIPDEKEAEVSKVLRHYDADADGEATEEYLNSISAAHLDEAAEDVEQTTSSYAVTITADKEKYAFFSIPDDDGWKATVNGKKSEIIDVNGMMAVKIPEGTSRIVFRYTVPGLGAGAALSLIAFIISILFLVRAKKREKLV